MLSVATQESYEQYKYQILLIYFSIGIGLISKLIGIASLSKSLPTWSVALGVTLSFAISGLFFFLIYKRKKGGFLIVFFLSFKALISIAEGANEIDNWTIILSLYYSVLFLSILTGTILSAYLNKKIFSGKPFFSL